MTPAKYDFPSQVRGDSINTRDVTITIDSAPADISAAIMNVRTSKNELIYNVSLSIVGNVVTIPEILGTVTEDWPIQTLKYDVQVTLASGKIRTYIQGSIPIKIDYSYV